MRIEIDVEALLRWAYVQQRVDSAPAGNAESCLRSSADSVSRVDGSRSSGGAARIVYGAAVHPAAEFVHDRVMSLERAPEFGALARRLIIDHTKSCDRPEWLRHASAVFAPAPGQRGLAQAFRDSNGRVAGHYIVPAVVWQRREGEKFRIRRLDAAECTPYDPVSRDTLQPALDQISMARDIYSIWWRALSHLTAELQRSTMFLPPYVVTGFLAPERPWDDAGRRAA